LRQFLRPDASVTTAVNALAMRTRALLASGRTAEGIAAAKDQFETTQRMYFARGIVVGSPVVDAFCDAGHPEMTAPVIKAYERVIAERNMIVDRRALDYNKAVIALAENRPKDALRLIRTGRPYGPPDGRDARRRFTLARALLGVGDHDQGREELRLAVARASYGSDPDILFPAMFLLAREEERAGRKNEALALYRRIVHQYRRADPGFKLAEEARAGAARLERAGAQAAAD
jgi:tetratricopeptide (TPR) repeat protein